MGNYFKDIKVRILLVMLEKNYLTDSFISFLLYF